MSGLSSRPWWLRRGAARAAQSRGRPLHKVLSPGITKRGLAVTYGFIVAKELNTSNKHLGYVSYVNPVAKMKNRIEPHTSQNTQQYPVLEGSRKPNKDNRRKSRGRDVSVRCTSRDRIGRRRGAGGRTGGAGRAGSRFGVGGATRARARARTRARARARSRGRLGVLRSGSGGVGGSSSGSGTSGS